MLVLSRKTGEQVRIGAGIEVKVLAIRGGRVRLGFSGPVGVPIHREEVFRRIEKSLSQRPCLKAPRESKVA